MRRVALAALVSLSLVGPVAAGGHQTFAWVPTSNRAVAVKVEQQPGVINPTSCPWSEDDDWINGSYGVLNPGTTSFTDCLIADNTYEGPPLTHLIGTHVLGLELVAGTPDLLVTVIYQPQNVTFTFTPRLVNGQYRYQGCVLGPVPDSSQLVQIDGSNGGWGVRGTITVLTTNPTSHKWQKTQAMVYLQADIPGDEATNLCREPLGAAGTGYEQNGALWQAGL